MTEPKPTWESEAAMSEVICQHAKKCPWNHHCGHGAPHEPLFFKIPSPYRCNEKEVSCDVAGGYGSDLLPGFMRAVSPACKCVEVNDE